MTRAIYERFKGGPIHVHVTLAASEVAGETIRMTLPTGAFEVPQVGICQMREGEIGWDVTSASNQTPALDCRWSGRGPRLTHVSVIWTDWQDGPCSGAQPESKPGVAGDQWIGTLEPGQRSVGLNPVSSMAINFTNNVEDNDEGRRFLCPGTPITFTTYHPTGRGIYEVDFDGIHLPASVATVQ